MDGLSFGRTQRSSQTLQWLPWARLSYPPQHMNCLKSLHASTNSTNLPLYFVYGFNLSKVLFIHRHRLPTVMEAPWQSWNWVRCHGSWYRLSGKRLLGQIAGSSNLVMHLQSDKTCTPEWALVFARVVNASIPPRACPVQGVAAIKNISTHFNWWVWSTLWVWSVGVVLVPSLDTLKKSEPLHRLCVCHIIQWLLASGTC